MRGSVGAIGAALLIATALGCQVAEPQPCREYDEAEALFERLSQENLDPIFGHPSFEAAAVRFEAVPDRCPRKERARFLADTIRRGLAMRRGEELKRQQERAAAAEREREEEERARSQRRRRSGRSHSRAGVYCSYKLKRNPLVEGKCYYESVYQAERRCRNHLRAQGDDEGRCTCALDGTRCPK